MYNNKKIVPIFLLNTFSKEYENTTSLASDLITIPNSCKTTNDFENYLLENNVQALGSRNYRTPTNIDFQQSSIADFTLRPTSNATSKVSFFYTFEKIKNQRFHFNVNEKVKNHLALSHLEYKWDVHEKIISQENFLPLIVDAESEFHTSLYNSLLKMPDLTFLPENFKTYSSDEILFLFWRDFSYSYPNVKEDPDSQKIYSSFSPGIFYSLKDSILNLDATSDSYQEQPFSFERFSSPRLSRNREYYSNRNAVEKLFSKFTFGLAHDFHLFKNTPQEPVYNNLIDAHNKKKLTVIKVPSWKSKSKDSKIELAAYTKNQCKTRNAAFMGIINHHQALLTETTQEKISSFSLVSPVSLEDIVTFSRSLKKIIELYNVLTWKEGLKIFDIDQANLILEQMYAGLNKYSNYCCEKVSEQNLNTLLDADLPTFSPLSLQQASTLSASPKVSLSIKKKYQKISLLFNKNLETISPLNLQATAENTQDSFNTIYNYRKAYEKAKQATSKLIDELTTIIGNVYNAASFINQNKLIHFEIKNKYFDEYKKSLDKKDYDIDEFFTNMSNDQIKINEISYFFENTPSEEKKLSSFSKKDDFVDFIHARNSEADFRYNEVTFLINKPIPIKIDNKDKYVVGGPYLVRCSKNSINISLAEAASLYGYKDGAFTIHPHTTSFSNPSSLFFYSNGCLGEATSLLYHAFKKNDLKLIILSAMTWVTSANSSDPWGRKCDWFPPLSHLKNPDETTPPDENVSSDVITEQEVDDFLISIFQEEESQENHEQAQELQDPLATEVDQAPASGDRWHPQNFTATPENYTPVFANLNNS